MSQYRSRPSQARLRGAGKRFGIAVARFNEAVTRKLLAGALNTLLKHGVDEKAIDVVWVPGSFEIPMALQRLARRKKYNALLALGAVIRGETPHFQHVAAEAARGVMEVALSNGIPIAFGILTTHNLGQALARAGGKRGNKGAQAAEAALEMANLFH